MKISELNSRSVCLLGYGREGRASYQAIRQHAPRARLTIADGNPNLPTRPDCPFITGPDYLERLSDFDLIVKSPGIPWHPPADLADRVITATQLFFDSLPDSALTIGVTGTKGKSTTSHLIYEALSSARDRRVILAGNIGEPMLAHLDDAAGTTFVLELSSYQLESLQRSPHIAVVTSFFPDHLDYHRTMAAYREAKSHIAAFQRPGDVVFYNAAYSDCAAIAHPGAGRKVPFTAEDYPGHDVAPGLGERSNLAAAYLVALECGIAPAAARQAIEHSKGLPHRQQSLGRFHGVRWIDDSAATTPESTVSALHALGSEVDVLITGGLDRGYDYAAVGEAIDALQIPHIVALPDTAAKLTAAIHGRTHVHEASTMAAAVATAKRNTRPGRVVLLSSGAPSYNQYRNYYERGDDFLRAIKSA
jgi:UDP-N-acetylmuramoylalanine-D-glutamate ligase